MKKVTTQKKLKLLIRIIFILGFFVVTNTGLAATTCEQKYQGYGQCADDCTALGADFQTDSDSGLCTEGKCCYKAQGIDNSSPIESIALQVPIFDVANVNDIAHYIATIYRYLVIILVPLAIIMIIVGGVSWILAAGDQGKITNAKKYIISSFSGLIIGLFSYVLLSLVGLDVLKTPEVEYISPLSGELLYIVDESGNVTVTTVSEGGEGMLPPARRGSAAAYQNKPCPKGQTSFDVFFTFYYKPKYNEKCDWSGHNCYEDFWCNIGMQCSCPLNAPGKAGSCKVHGNRCKQFGPDVAYCNSTASLKPPIGGYTIAADIPRPGRRNSACFKLGCKFKIEGDARTYEIMDTGSTKKIIGLHMDYFADAQNNKGIPPATGVYNIQLLTPESCFN